MVYDLGLRVCILWFMVYGLWFMVYGLWFMVCGLWFMVYGLWFMVCGLRFMVYGLWLILHDLWFKHHSSHKHNYLHQPLRIQNIQNLIKLPPLQHRQARPRANAFVPCAEQSPKIKFWRENKQKHKRALTERTQPQPPSHPRANSSNPRTPPPTLPPPAGPTP